MIQIVYDKIVNFCGVNEIPCVIVGSKTDLQQRYVIPHRYGELAALYPYFSFASYFRQQTGSPE